jgi:hypothetical protein
MLGDIRNMNFAAPANKFNANYFRAPNGQMTFSRGLANRSADERNLFVNGDRAIMRLIKLPLVCILVGLIPLGFVYGAEMLLPTSIVRTYLPISSGTDSALGFLRLSERFASFSRIKGHMDLEFAGVLPDFGIRQISGASIYRVVNADEFYRDNRVTLGPCPRPITWLGVVLLKDFQPAPNEPRNAVRVSLFTISNYRNYDPNQPGLCRTDTYALPSN